MYIYVAIPKQIVMKKETLILASTIVMFACGNAIAQKIRLETGNIAEVMKEKTINIKYDYSSFGVGKYKTEAEYVKYKMEAAEKEAPGGGERWKQGWEGARESRYQPKFEELINKGLMKKGIVVKAAPESKYTLTVKTTFVEPGFNVGVMRHNAEVSFEYIFTETANPSIIVAKMTQEKVPGGQFGGGDYDMGSRLAESYAKGGKMLAAYLSD